VDRVVAVALPRPLELKEQDDYKLALAFDHDRHLTGWLTLIDARTRAKREEHLRLVAERQRAHARRFETRSKRFLSKDTTEDEKVFFDFERDFDAYPPYVPMVRVAFTRGEGGVIERADAEVVPVSPTYLRTHRHFVREFYNTSVWPKHVLIRYTWHTQLAVDEDAGVAATLLVFTTAFLAAAAFAASATRWADVAAFVDALGAEEDRKAEARVSRTNVPSNSFGKSE
jgi:hypothetical protein